MNTNKMLWIGSYQSLDSFLNMPIKNMGQASARTSQEGLIHGIDSLLDERTIMDTIGIIPYAPYPIYPARYVQQERWQRGEHTIDISAGYLNIKYFNYYFREKALIREVKKWGYMQENNRISTVFVYAPTVGKMHAALYLKEKYKCQIFMIIPDIPENISVGADRIVLTVKHLVKNILDRMMKKADGWILYSEFMAQYYGLKSEDWILVEGVISNNDINSLEKIQKTHVHNTVLFYCGSLDVCRGIPEILKAFRRISDPKLELWFAGTGQCDGMIKEFSEVDSRIKHLGFISDRMEMLRLVKEADILLHTRDTKTESLIKYSFPSKLFEYMASGNIVLSVRMLSIPNEYDDHLIYIDELSEEELYQGMNKILSMEYQERRKFGEEARSFIVSSKNSIAQAKKILNLVRLKSGDGHEGALGM